MANVNQPLIINLDIMSLQGLGREVVLKFSSGTVGATTGRGNWQGRGRGRLAKTGVATSPRMGRRGGKRGNYGKGKRGTANAATVQATATH